MKYHPLENKDWYWTGKKYADIVLVHTQLNKFFFSVFFSVFKQFQSLQLHSESSLKIVYNGLVLAAGKIWIESSVC